MRIARVTGTATATVKDPALSGATLLVVDVEDGAGAVLEKSIVVADACGAGVGDMVLIALGSAARMPAGAAGAPVDATAVAGVDRVDLAAPAGRPARASTGTASRRKR